MASPAARRDSDGRGNVEPPGVVLHAAGEDTRAPGRFVNPPYGQPAPPEEILNPPTELCEIGRRSRHSPTAVGQPCRLRTTMTPVPAIELQTRLERFRAHLDTVNPDWELAAILSKINLYYFTGTTPEGLLLVPRAGDAEFWVRRSHERALAESLFPRVQPMESYRDAAATKPRWPRTVHLETEKVPLAMYQRLQKHFGFEQIRPVDGACLTVRAVKSEYELEQMARAGEIHRRVLEEQVPGMLRQGMTEAELSGELYAALIAAGHHGVARFAMFDTEMALGFVSFGDNSIYPNCFNGPGGNRGMCAAVPVLGSPARRLQAGDLVFIDVGCGVEGYHTDKTMTYGFGGALPPEAQAAQARCVELEHAIAARLQPGVVPSEIYQTTLRSLDADFQQNFMGFGPRRVKFLGHGIGLVVDEWPVIAEGFDEPLQAGMTLALEPKKGLAGIGTVGIENTFVVTPQGGRSLTGDHPGLLAV